MNRLSKSQSTLILRCLVDGNSLRAITRITGHARDTITKLMLRIGHNCQSYLDGKLTNLKCRRIQIDEIWSFIGCKDKSIIKGKIGLGSIWTWVAMDPDTKLVVSWLNGERNNANTRIFVEDLATRLSSRVQLTSDGYTHYKEVMENAFHGEVDYTMLVKRYENNRYVGCKKRVMCGKPKEEHKSTSLVERQNLTMRMCIRRFTRKTNAFSKSIANHECAVALHFMYYNFVRIHQSLKITPAMAHGLSKRLWKLEDLLFLK